MIYIFPVGTGVNDYLVTSQNIGVYRNQHVLNWLIKHNTSGYYKGAENSYNFNEAYIDVDVAQLNLTSGVAYASGVTRCSYLAYLPDESQPYTYRYYKIKGAQLRNKSFVRLFIEFDDVTTFMGWANVHNFHVQKSTYPYTPAGVTTPYNGQGCQQLLRIENADTEELSYRNLTATEFSEWGICALIETTERTNNESITRRRLFGFFKDKITFNNDPTNPTEPQNEDFNQLNFKSGKSISEYTIREYCEALLKIQQIDEGEGGRYPVGGLYKQARVLKLFITPYLSLPTEIRAFKNTQYFILNQNKFSTEGAFVPAVWGIELPKIYIKIIQSISNTVGQNIEGASREVLAGLKFAYGARSHNMELPTLVGQINCGVEVIINNDLKVILNYEGRTLDITDSFTYNININYDSLDSQARTAKNISIASSAIAGISSIGAGIGSIVSGNLLGVAATAQGITGFAQTFADNRMPKVGGRNDEGSVEITFGENPKSSKNYLDYTFAELQNVTIWLLGFWVFSTKYGATPDGLAAKQQDIDRNGIELDFWENKFTGNFGGVRWVNNSKSTPYYVAGICEVSEVPTDTAEKIKRLFAEGIHFYYVNEEGEQQ